MLDFGPRLEEYVRPSFIMEYYIRMEQKYWVRMVGRGFPKLAGTFGFVFNIQPSKLFFFFFFWKQEQQFYL